MGGEAKNADDDHMFQSNDRIEDFAKMISRSRSVGVGTTAAVTSSPGTSDVSPSSGKGKFWSLKAFRSSKSTPKAGTVQDQSSFNKG